MEWMFQLFWPCLITCVPIPSVSLEKGQQLVQTFNFHELFWHHFLRVFHRLLRAPKNRQELITLIILKSLFRSENTIIHRLHTFLCWLKPCLLLWIGIKIMLSNGLWTYVLSERLSTWKVRNMFVRAILMRSHCMSWPGSLSTDLTGVGDTSDMVGFYVSHHKRPWCFISTNVAFG